MSDAEETIVRMVEVLCRDCAGTGAGRWSRVCGVCGGRGGVLEARDLYRLEDWPGWWGDEMGYNYTDREVELLPDPVTADPQ